MPQMSARKACIFDLDGTLVDTLEDIGGACNVMLAHYGLPLRTMAEYRTFVGNGFVKLVRRALPADLGALEQNDIQKYIDAALQAYVDNHLEKSCAYPHVHEMLKSLQEKGWELAVFSNKPHKLTQSVVTHLFADIPFFAVQGAVPEMPLKPAPDNLFAMLNAADLRPEQCVFVGDSDVDMKTAHNAGIRSVGVSWGFNGLANVIEHGAGHTVTDALQIVSYCDRL